MNSTSEIRQSFLAFFEANGHAIVASSPLVPGNDKTLLFTNAGMVQFKDVFTGEEKRAYTRATTSQRCVRAGGKHNDLDNVGYTARHHTFFEMLGNFSFGDYSKPEAIQFAWNFLTVELGLPADKLWVTVFEEDDEAEEIWTRDIGVPAARVIRIGAKDNFWAMGDTGPCGPCSEIFFDHGPEVAGGPPGSPEEDGDRYIEIWNLVFMQYDRQADGSLTPLPKPCVDTGMGLERIAAVLQHVHSNYEIDLFQRLIAAVAAELGTADHSAPSLRVIADHIRSCAFLIVDGVMPGNEGRGYVLRRIIRRAARHGNKLGATAPFFHKLVPALAAEMGKAYPELREKQSLVQEQLLQEEQRFNKTLVAGLSILDEALANLIGTVIPGEVVFRLYDTYGFPADLTADIARERDLEVDTEGFEQCMQAQRVRARAASNFGISKDSLQSDATTEFLGYEHDLCDASVIEILVDGKSVPSLSTGQTAWIVLDRTPFYGESGGQVGDTGVLEQSSGRFEVADTRKQRQAFFHGGELSSGSMKVGDSISARIDGDRRHRIRQNHSATHLLHGALREVLGTHVEQRGSLVNDAHLRFDFSHGSPVGADELARVEQWIDREVHRNSESSIQEMDMEAAKKSGAMALFGEKYGDRVRVVKLGDRSIELCGGTHVSSTGEIGNVRIVAESSVASGVRRIEAVSGAEAVAQQQQVDQQLGALASMLKSSRSDVIDKVEQLMVKNRELTRELERLQAQASAGAGLALAERAETLGDAKVLFHAVENSDAKQLRQLSDQLKQHLGKCAIVLASEHGGKAALIASVSDDLTDQVKAGDMLKQVAEALGGRGGGRADMAQGGAPSLAGVEAAFTRTRDWLADQLSG